MSRCLKMQSFNDENLPSLSSKVQLLERELAEKTDLLKRTAKNLADSQRQYQNLLMEFENFKSQVFGCNRCNNSNSFMKSQTCFSSKNVFSSFSSLDDSNSNSLSNYKKSLQQLQNVEGNVQNLTLQNQSLKSKIDRLTHDQREWQIFANSVYSSIHDFVSFKKDFPDDDSEAQRFILLDLIQKLTKKCSTELPNENLQHKYRISKLKLKQVQIKCDKILQLLDEKGYDISSFESSIPRYKSKKRHSPKQIRYLNILNDSDDGNGYNYDSESDDRQDQSIVYYPESDPNNNFDELHAFKNDVKKLAGVTHNMKDHYKNYAKLSKKQKL